MNNTEHMNVRGTVILKLYDSESYQIKKSVTVKNMIVNGGLDFFIKKSADFTTDTLEKIGISSGETAPTMQDIELDDPYAAEYSDLRYKSNTDIGEILLESVFPSENYVGTVKEIGLFTNTDTMIARTVIPADQQFEKTVNDYLSIIWKIKLG